MPRIPVTPHAAAPYSLRLAAGDLAYLDSFSGLVPCKVRAICETDRSGQYEADVVVTATRGAYHRGDKVRASVGLVCIPRTMVFRSRGRLVLSGTIVPIPSEV